MSTSTTSVASSSSTQTSSPPSPLPSLSSKGNESLTSSTPSASSSSSSPSLITGAKTIHPQDLLHVHEMPCARQALLFGLGAGFGLGGLRFVFASTRRAGTPRMSSAAWRSMNWFVGAWALGSIAAFQFCQRQRELERKGIGRAVEIMERKKREKEEEMRQARETVRRRREEARRLEEERRQRWWGLGRWLPGGSPSPSPSLLKKPDPRQVNAPQSVSAGVESLRKDAKGEDNPSAVDISKVR